ncbi:UPF0721 transmembrane protein [Cellvibrio zantedeschiae]|uniref:Probable membrane transporter protein n=1 Tax=Cellvibrio zantedeschiae TaxID=1237077 RepID=A0ABQ3AQC9_9GAMM|nr:sulfite exporter TauE/SafE family protein [Cellvibrio zantedeschiae]GGY64470.1 UPF0721 transmembrane protein [Cellvibrio zantedeschiae]
MLILIGALIGLVLGLTGAGGSVFAVPLLILLAGLPMSSAVGLSLGAVAASSFYGSLRIAFGKNGVQKILWLPGVLLAGTGALTAPLGKFIGMHVPETWLLAGFSLLAAAIATRMWLAASRHPDTATIVRASNYSNVPVAGLVCNLSTNGQFQLRPRCIGGLFIGGAAVGVLSGLFGVGGGFLIVPLLLFLSPINIVQAVATSLPIIAVVSSAGFFSHFATSNDWKQLGLAAGGGVLGMMIGQTLSQRIANARLQKIFAVCLLLISSVTLVRNFL